MAVDACGNAVVRLSKRGTPIMRVMVVYIG